MLVELILIHLHILCSEPWYENSRIGVNTIGDLLPSLCEIAKVPRLTNHSIRTTSIRAMRRSGFDDNQVCFVSGHKDPESLKNYDSLTVFDRTKMAMAMQHGSTTLDGEEIDLNVLARKKRKGNDQVGEGPSKRLNDEAEKVFHVVVDHNDSGFGGSEASSRATEASDNDLTPADVNPVIVVTQQNAANEIVLSQNDTNEMPRFILSDNNVGQEHANSQPDTRSISSFQSHNVAKLIDNHITSSKELINNYLAAMKKKN